MRVGVQMKSVIKLTETRLARTFSITFLFFFFNVLVNVYLTECAV